jgi:uncharacterized protein (UPF0548 family)
VVHQLGTARLAGGVLMLLFHRPSRDEVHAFIAVQAETSFSYAEVGASRGDPPAGYTLDHNRVELGRGPAVFDKALAALRRWQMFAVDGVDLCWPTAPIEEGTTVAIVAGGRGVWSLNACRIVYVVDERGPLTRVGFAYGTLAEHAVRGEERFLIEWSRDSHAVHYDLLAFSRPGSLLVDVARPLLRRIQRRFARHSLEAMRRAVGA